VFLVLDRDPFVGDLPDLIQIFKEISIQDFTPIGSIEPIGRHDTIYPAVWDNKLHTTTDPVDRVEVILS
jgi:hypothetical protein